eukprot:jgi/Mesen1/7519/ME000039S06740
MSFASRRALALLKGHLAEIVPSKFANAGSIANKRTAALSPSTVCGLRGISSSSSLNQLALPVEETRDWLGNADVGKTPAPAGHMPRVADRMITITVVDLEGRRQPIRGLYGEGQTLLDALKRSHVDTGCPCDLHDRGLEVCMGNCHVLVPTEWLAHLPPRGEKELYVLKSHSATGTADRGLKGVNAHSRLSCLVPLSRELDNMVISLTEEIPGDIP